MGFSFATILDELQGLLFGLHASDFAIPIGLLMWALVLAIPLSKINCLEPFTGLNYTLTCATFAIAMVIALPQRYHTIDSFALSIPWIILFCLVAGLRWLSEVVKQKSAAMMARKKEDD